ncbi:Nitrilase family, member 2 [Seminavis robusta]|uniref:Nitrilase family, member 2 n=1 Tax=Seminavis robusta TaxID=568900 RepID=A0A9N8HBB1_9STRA|nr:Nitrilase family, member 2 [Seminavis robusta]|eukprot:Sro270_g104360.1 Nitrilase family, member 2 (344) ;mRNA; f:74856-76020
MSDPGSPDSNSHNGSHGYSTITYDPSRRPRRKMEKTILPESYEPSKFSVICGRGKGSYQSDGNINFRALVKSNLERYKEAPGRLEKSFIVSEVLNCIRESCPVGAFVKYEKGRWYDLDDTVCREKVGSLFRDFLHTTYKSSSKAKHAKKVKEKSQQQDATPTPTRRSSKTSSGPGTPTSSPEKASPTKKVKTTPTAKRRTSSSSSSPKKARVVGTSTETEVHVLLPPPPVLESVRIGKLHPKPSRPADTPASNPPLPSATHKKTQTTQSPILHGVQQQTKPTRMAQPKPKLSTQKVLPRKKQQIGHSPTKQRGIMQTVTPHDCIDPLAKKFYDIDDLKPLKLE